MLRITNIKMPVVHTVDELKIKAAKLLKIDAAKIKEMKITGKAIDARNKSDIYYVYSVSVRVPDEKRFLGLKNVTIEESIEYVIKRFAMPIEPRPVVVGSGPAGLFAGLILAEYGLCPVILERGKPVDERKADVYNLFETGRLNTESNIQFGEGGAGTFSDGKLTTNTNDNIRIKKVIEELIKSGADEEIAYTSKPHIGTDKLVEVVKMMRARIQSLGGEYRFCHKLKGIAHENGCLKAITIQSPDGDYEMETNAVIMAVGHSARDTFDMLYASGVSMMQKPFSVGVRIEHKQNFINSSQYGRFAELLPPADYKLSTKLNDGRGVYTFCMCPGGVVVPAASEEGLLATNGMSYNDRGMDNANSAVLVSVDTKDFGGDHPLAGIEFQRKLEKQAFELGGGKYFAPAQLVGDFINNTRTTAFGNVIPSYKPGVTPANLNECLPIDICDALKQGLNDMDKRIFGFLSHDAVLTAVESRSSSPVRIIRDEKMFSNIIGLIPCGEGAGYAGGIVSAAVDGIKCAEALCRWYKENMI